MLEFQWSVLLWWDCVLIMEPKQSRTSLSVCFYSCDELNLVILGFITFLFSWTEFRTVLHAVVGQGETRWKQEKTFTSWNLYKHNALISLYSIEWGGGVTSYNCGVLWERQEFPPTFSENIKKTTKHLCYWVQSWYHGSVVFIVYVVDLFCPFLFSLVVLCSALSCFKCSEL